MLLDSGSEFTLLSPDLVEELGLESGEELGVHGVGGDDRSHRVSDVRLSLGGWTLTGVEALALDLGFLQSTLGREIHGVIGRVLFENFVVDLDYPNSRVRLVESGTFTAPAEGSASAALRLVPRGLQVEISVANRPSAFFDLDTGSNAELAVYPQAWEDGVLLDGVQTLSNTWAMGVGGGLVSRIGTLDQVSLGGVSLRAVPTTFVDPGARAFSSGGGDGNLGNRLLERFRLQFDLAQGSLFLQAGPELARPFLKDRAGLSLQLAGGELEVVHVAKGSPALLSGWKVGERIQAVNATPVGADYWQKLGDWSKGEAGTRVQLSLTSGEVRELELAEYY